MSTPPKELFWVEMKLSGDPIPYRLNRAGVRGGKRSSLAACLDSKRAILRADPRAEVRIFSTVTDWVER